MRLFPLAATNVYTRAYTHTCRRVQSSGNGSESLEMSGDERARDGVLPHAYMRWHTRVRSCHVTRESTWENTPGEGQISEPR